MKDNWAGYNDAGFCWMDCIDYSYLGDPAPGTQKYAPCGFDLYTSLYIISDTLIKTFFNINFMIHD